MKHVVQDWSTFFVSSMRQTSKEVWKIEFHLLVSFPILNASIAHCKHLRKCLIRSPIIVTIDTEACNCACCAISVTTFIMLTCKSICLATFLWSKCLTIYSSKWLFCPDDNKPLTQYPSNKRRSKFQYKEKKT